MTPPTPARPLVQPRSLLAVGAAGAVGVAAFAMARLTLLPDVAIWDTGEAQTVPPLLGTMHPTGYPSYVLLGWLASSLLAPFGSPAFLMNLLSAVLLGVAAAATVGLAHLLTGRLAIAVAAGLGAAATPVVWSLGIRADVHALHLALVALLLVALVAWQRAHEQGREHADRLLIAAAVTFGVALGGHRLVAFLVPGIAAFVLLVDRALLRRPRFVLGTLGIALGVAALLYLELPVRAGLFPAPLVYGHPETFSGFWYVVLGTQFGGALASPLADPGGVLERLGSALSVQLGPLGPLALVAGLATAVLRPGYAVLTVPAVLLTWLFAAAYENAAIERYLAVPLLIAWSWLAVGAGAIVDSLVDGAPRREGSRREGERGAVDDGARPQADGETDRGTTGPAAAGAAPTVAARTPLLPALLAGAAAVMLLIPTVIALPGRWARIDASGDTSGRRWLESALAALPTDAVVVSWWSYSTPLWYAQHIEHRRRDILVVDDRTRLDEGLGGVSDVIDANLGRRPVYIIRVDLDELAALHRRYRLSIVSLPTGQSLLRVDGPRPEP